MRTGGTIVWLAVGAYVVILGADSAARFATWAIAFAAFGAGLLFSASRERPSLPMLVVQVAAVMTLVLTLCNGYEGTLLVIVAMQLGGVLPRRTALLWIVAQTLLLAVCIGIHWSPRPAMMLAPPYLGFQLLAFLAFDALARESIARDELAASNAELRALQNIVADSSRIAERLRISRELHDAIGHHLTALLLNLEAALQKSSGSAREHVSAAQSLARQLLQEVRDIVAAMSEAGGIDVEQTLQSLTAGLPRPHVHLAVEPRMTIDNPERARIIVRCAQEIVTNAARHSGAQNLWIAIDREGDAVRIRAHDDGCGGEVVPEGFGLRAMRERVEGAGGELHIVTRPGLGYDVTALVPA